MSRRHAVVRRVIVVGLVPLIGMSVVIGRDMIPLAQRDRPSSLVQRPAIDPPSPQPRGGGGDGRAVFPMEYRSIDGTNNNLANPLWGAAGTTLLRLTPMEYADGIGDLPAGMDRASARNISNLLCAQSDSITNVKRASAYLWQWGQFLDHDLDETPITDPAEPFDIPVPAGDPWFDPDGTGTVVIGLDRSAFVMVDGVRQQLNNITSYIDASNVYGSEPSRALELRTMDGTGRLKTSPGGLLPFNINAFPNAPTPHDPSFFLAGDVRSNEQVALTAMHTLFVREHNFWVSYLNMVMPAMTGDEVYEHARAIVAAEMQAITYNEFLPVLLGPDALTPYAGYDPGVNAGVSNVFATAAYRMGHTLLSSPLMRTDRDGNEIPAGHLALADAFFAPSHLRSDGIDPLLRGLCGIESQEVDTLIRNDVRNFLFGPPGAGGFDLASLNIQRGRDHGLASYNAVRVAFGRTPAVTFADVSPDPQVQTALAAAYDTCDDIDAWIGMLAEPHRPGAMVGETLFRVLADQFIRTRDGDRFWYQSYLPNDMVQMVEQQTLATIIRRNTAISTELPDDLFMMPPDCPADVVADGQVNVFDLVAVLKAWGPCPGCPEDVVEDGVVDVFDLIEVLDSWGACP